MARVKIDTLGISELKWTGMGEFNSDDHYIYYYGQKFFRRNGLAITVNKRIQNAVLGYSLKNGRMISVHFQIIQYHSNPSLCPTNNAEEAEIEWFYEDLQDLLELTPKKDDFFIRDWNAKVGSQEIPGVTANLALEYRMKQGKS